MWYTYIFRFRSIDKCRTLEVGPVVHHLALEPNACHQPGVCDSDTVFFLMNRTPILPAEQPREEERGWFQHWMHSLFPSRWWMRTICQTPGVLSSMACRLSPEVPALTVPVEHKHSHQGSCRYLSVGRVLVNDIPFFCSEGHLLLWCCTSAHNGILSKASSISRDQTSLFLNIIFQ